MNEPRLKTMYTIDDTTERIGIEMVRGDHDFVVNRIVIPAPVSRSTCERATPQRELRIPGAVADPLRCNADADLSL